MVRALMPRWLIFPLILIFVTSFALTNRMSKHDPTFLAMVRLLEWHDPVTGELLNLPIDRNAPLYEQITELQTLRRLDLSSSQLSELPPEIGNLANLRVLYLHRNQLSELPSEMGNLRNLAILEVSDNPLSELPPEIAQLPHVRIYQ